MCECCHKIILFDTQRIPVKFSWSEIQKTNKTTNVFCGDDLEVLFSRQLNFTRKLHFRNNCGWANHPLSVTQFEPDTAVLGGAHLTGASFRPY